MGSWNKTCGLTNLPIMDGERVIMLPLIESKHKSSTYSCGEWELIPTPFYGSYSDYGWMDFDDGYQNNLALLYDYYNKRLVRTEPYDDNGYIRYPDLKDSPFENTAAFGDSMHGDVFMIKDYASNADLRLKHMMIREDAFNTLKAKLFISDENREDGTSDMHEEYITHVLNKFREYFRANTDLTSKFLGSTVDSFIEGELPTIRTEFGITVGQYHWYHLDSNIINYAFHPYYTSGSSNGFETQSFLRLNNDNLSVSDIINLYATIDMFSSLRKSYAPQSGEGSQEGLNKYTQAFPFAYMKASIASHNYYDEVDKTLNNEFEDKLKEVTVLYSQILDQ